MNHIATAQPSTRICFNNSRQDMLAYFAKLISEGRSSDDLKSEVDATASAMHQLIALGC